MRAAVQSQVRRNELVMVGQTSGVYQHAIKTNFKVMLAELG